MTGTLIEATASELQIALDAGAARAKPVTHGDTVSFVVPAGYDVAQFTDVGAERPSRKRGIVRPATVASLVIYTKRHLTGSTTVWVHPTSGQVVSVLDDHEQVLAGHAQHRADLQLKHTPEWDFWTANDGGSLNQSAFAEHIEDGAKEIVEPSPASLLEIASTFHAKSDVQFRQASRLTDGTVQLQYDEVIAASAGKSGEITIPQEFKLAISPFVGEPKYSITARLRYRLCAGKLTLSYRLERPHDIVRDALENIANRIDEAFPGVVFIGTPRA